MDVERDNPRRPDPPPSHRRKSDNSLLPVVMVLVPLVILIVGIVSFTGKAGLLMLAVIACVPAFVMVHYLLWGYWLSKSLRNADPAGEEDDQPEP